MKQKTKQWGKRAEDALINPRNRDVVKHNHKSRGQLVYDGYAKTAPQYHVFRCQVKQDCSVTSIFSCPRRMSLGSCRICEDYSEVA